MGIRILSRMRRYLTPAHFEILDAWVDHLTNWANTDGLATWLIAETIRKDPALYHRLLDWTSSENRWRRRAASTTLCCARPSSIKSSR